jgi:Protein of unknown function (DUF2950)
MKSQRTNSTNSSLYLRAVVFLLAAVCVLGCSGRSVMAADSEAQTTFVSPAEAGQGDPAEDRAALQSFVAKYDRMNRWVTMTDGSRVLYIGSDNYAFPVPLVPDSSSMWHFDTAAGEREIVARGIGRNELLAIDAASSIGNTEELYFQRARVYTPTIISKPGQKDGLYWNVPNDQTPRPLGRLSDFANSAVSPGTLVFDGYAFRILTAQGDEAKGGAKNYMTGGKMTGGFAIIATPVRYQDSGVMTFIMSREGVVYQKDLGADTANAAASITSYNPTDGDAGRIENHSLLFLRSRAKAIRKLSTNYPLLTNPKRRITMIIKIFLRRRMRS